MLRVNRAPLIAALALLLSLRAFAFSQIQPEPVSDPDVRWHDPARRLVRNIIQNELREEDKDHSHFIYVDYMRHPGGEKSRKVVESNVLDLKLLIAKDGHPLTPLEQEQQIQQLQKLISDPSEQEKERRNQDEDAAKAKRMLKMIPEAFLYKIERVNGDLTTLSARPDPSYSPSNREETVFHSIGGTITLNTREKRLVELRGELLEDVKFGFGILADLQKGGTILVQQTEVAPHIWRITELDVNITGRALFFKSIGTQQNEHMGNFRRLPKSVPLQFAFSLLHETANTKNTQ